jgi:hypothetical protein
MIDVLKWEFYKKIQDFKIFYLILLGIAIVDLVIPANSKDYSQLVGIISSVFSGVTFFMITIYLIVGVVNDLRRPNNVMEKLIDKKPWEIIGGKLINNALQFTIIYVIVYTISMILRRFSTGGTKYLTIYFKLPMLISISLALPLVILFFYLLSLKFKFTKDIPIFSTVCYLIITSTVISSIKSNFPFNNMIWSIISIIIFVSVFYLSCILYEKAYEV